MAKIRSSICELLLIAAYVVLPAGRDKQHLRMLIDEYYGI
jgi:hypothetical protein